MGCHRCLTLGELLSILRTTMNSPEEGPYSMPAGDVPLQGDSQRGFVTQHTSTLPLCYYWHPDGFKPSVTLSILGVYVRPDIAHELLTYMLKFIGNVFNSFYRKFDSVAATHSPEWDPARELSNRAFWLAPSNSSTESFIAVWNTANWPKTTDEERHTRIVRIIRPSLNNNNQKKTIKVK